MRLKITLALAAAVAAAGGAVVAAAQSAPAQQIVCPPGTVARYVKLPTGGTVTVCVPGMECDPGPCPSTAPPARD